MDSTVALAERIARTAHTGQVDKAGRPYAEHPARVAARCVGDRAKATAWLHDVIEDTDWTRDDLLAAGIPVEVVDDVELLSHPRGEPRAVYIARVRRSPVAVEVKRADVADNRDPERVALLDPATAARLDRKYDETLALLDA